MAKKQKKAIQTRQEQYKPGQIHRNLGTLGRWGKKKDRFEKEGWAQFGCGRIPDHGGGQKEAIGKASHDGKSLANEILTLGTIYSAPFKRVEKPFDDLLLLFISCFG